MLNIFLLLALQCRTFQSMLSMLRGAQALKLQLFEENSVDVLSIN